MYLHDPWLMSYFLASLDHMNGSQWSHMTLSCPLRRLRKVGWIFTQSVAERDWIMDSEEVQQMAAVQVQMQ
jgi:hypothetical protein